MWRTVRFYLASTARDNVRPRVRSDQLESASNSRSVFRSASVSPRIASASSRSRLPSPVAAPLVQTPVQTLVQTVAVSSLSVSVSVDELPPSAVLKSPALLFLKLLVASSICIVLEKNGSLAHATSDRALSPQVP